MSVFERAIRILFPGSRLFLAAILISAAFLAGAPARAEDPQAAANRQFVEAMLLIRKADASLEPKDETTLLLEANRLLEEIVQKYPESSIAVQLITNQFIGDFDVFQFRSRLRALQCNAPLSTACFLYRIEELLPPVDEPITAPRWDWLSLAVAQHHLGSPDKARDIIVPFLGALRRGAPARYENGDLFVARALALTGQMDMGIEITRNVDDCSTRLYNLADLVEIALWQGAGDKAVQLAEEAQAYASANACAWELGLVVQALLKAGKEGEARTLFLNTVEQQFSRFRESRSEPCCPAELAVAAADLGEANLALGLLRTVQDDSPWTIPAVLGRLSAHGEVALANAFLEEIEDPDLRAEILAEFVAAALRRSDMGAAEENLKKLAALSERKPERALVLVHRARAEKLLYGDDQWRTTFQAALNAAERSSGFVRREIGVPLLAALVKIETGLPMLD